MSVPVPIAANYPRVTWFFKNPTSTWTETHWYISPGVSLQTVLDAAVILNNQRANSLSGDSSPQDIRVSYENVFRDALSEDLSQFDITSGLDNQNLAGDTLKLLYNSTPLYRRIGYLGGIPDGAIQNGKYSLGNDPVFDVALNQFRNAIVGAGLGPWGFLALDKSVSNPRVGISSIVGTMPAPGTYVITVTTLQPHGQATGSVVRLSRTPYRTLNFKLNDTWRVTVLNATTFTLNNPLPFAVPFSSGESGYAQGQLKVFQPYTSAVVDGARTRKRGARNFLPLGRSRRRNIACS